MGKLALATKLSDELGSTVDEAYRFVEEVGVAPARNALDEAAQAGARTVSNWWKPAAGVGAIGGAGAIAWRQQDIARAKAIASQSQSYSESVKAIMQSDLPPSRKRELLQDLNQNAPSANNGGGGGGGGGNPLSNLLDFGGIKGTVGLVVVFIIISEVALGGE